MLSTFKNNTINCFHHENLIISGGQNNKYDCGPHLNKIWKTTGSCTIMSLTTDISLVIPYLNRLKPEKAGSMTSEMLIKIIETQSKPEGIKTLKRTYIWQTRAFTNIDNIEKLQES